MAIYKGSQPIANDSPIDDNTIGEDSTYSSKKINDMVDSVSTVVQQNTEELHDIRTGADNIAYETAGKAVREQLNNISQTIEHYDSIALDELEGMFD